MTSLEGTATIEIVRVRRLSVVVTLMLIASMPVSVWANCMANVGMQAVEQMACCKDGHDKCPMHNTAADCCTAESQRHQEVSVATHETSSSVVNPSAIVATAVTADVAPITIRLSHLPLHRTVLKGPAPPPYLLGSAFLV